MAGKVENKTKHALRYKTRTKALRTGYKIWTHVKNADRALWTRYKTRRKVQNTDFLPSDHGASKECYLSAINVTG